MPMKTRIILLTLLLIPFSSHSAIYKCKNAKGQIEFSDMPCATSNKRTIEVRPNYQRSTSGGTGLSLDERRLLRKIEQRERKRDYDRELERRYPIQQPVRNNNSACNYYKSRITYYADGLRRGCRSSTCEYYRERKRHYSSKLYQDCR